MLNRCLEAYLHCFVSEEPHKWSLFLHLTEFWYNTSFHSSIGMSPFEDLYRHAPPTVPSNLNGSTKVATLDEFLIYRQGLLNKLKEQLHSARNRMKQRADIHRREVNFDLGDWVHLRLQPYQQVSVASRRSHKLSRRFYGPFQIVKRIGEVAYELDLPPTAKIHRIFHVHAPPLPWHSRSADLPLARSHPRHAAPLGTSLYFGTSYCVREPRSCRPVTSSVGVSK